LAADNRTRVRQIALFRCAPPSGTRPGRDLRTLDRQAAGSCCGETVEVGRLFLATATRPKDFRQTSLIDFRNPAVKRSLLIRNGGSKECAYSSQLLHSLPPSRSQDASKVRKALRDQLELQGRRDPKAIRARWDQLGRRDRPVPRVQSVRPAQPERRAGMFCSKKPVRTTLASSFAAQAKRWSR
jgi:hypothetical protein